MTKMERVVRLLRDALAGRARVDGVLNAIGHCEVPVRVDGSLITFWMRSELRRVERVEFADGSTADSDEFEGERWISPREFQAWWRWTSGFEHATLEELAADEKAKFQELRDARDSGDWSRRLRAH